MLRKFALSILTAVLFIFPSHVEAEWFMEPYAGAAFTDEDSPDVSASGGGFTLNGKLKDLELEDSFLFGLRTGRWLESFENLGFAVDVFYFEPEIESQTATFSGTGSVTVGNQVIVGAGSAQAQISGIDLKVIGISADLMLRLLPAERRRTTLGQIHPYIFAGPTLYISELDDETEADLGLKAGAGLNWLFTPHLGVFVEYRFNYFEPEYELKSGGTRVKFESEISSHQVIAGLSFRF